MKVSSAPGQGATFSLFLPGGETIAQHFPPILDPFQPRKAGTPVHILETTDLKKYYGTEPNLTRALDGVNFTVEEGEFVAVVGTSGSGKSTLLHLVGGLDTPTSGTVTVRGQALDAMNDEQLTIFRRRNIGFVFQHYNLVPMLNVYENIVLPVELDGETPTPPSSRRWWGCWGWRRSSPACPTSSPAGSSSGWPSPGP